MYAIRKARAEDFEAIYPLLIKMDDSFTKDEWKKIFINYYDASEKYHGFVVFDQKKAIGFMGLIFSERLINGCIKKIGNMCTWIVNEKYRGQGIGRSLLLELVQLVNLNDYTLTNLTPAPRTVPMLIECGYKELETHCKIILPVPTLDSFINNCSVDFDREFLYAHLNDKEKKIYRDHVQLKCEYVLIRSENEYCYLIITRGRRRNIVLAQVHFISNLNVFLKCIRKIALLVCLRLKVFGLIVDERFLFGNRVKYTITCGTRKYYLSKSLNKNNITDNLYTELLILLTN